MYVLNEYMAFGVDTPHIATYNFKLVFHLLFSTIYKVEDFHNPPTSCAVTFLWLLNQIRKFFHGETMEHKFHSYDVDIRKSSPREMFIYVFENYSRTFRIFE